jgi:thiol-disulfide isomerase/thioredoxin
MKAFILIWLLALTPLALSEDLAAKVMIFIATDCPIANSYAPEFERLRKDYGGKKVDFLLVYPDPALTEAAVKKHLTDYGMTLPTKIDRDHALVKQAGVTTTPEVAVLGADGTLLYRGRIDNLYADYGERRRTITEPYLRNALDAILRGEKPALPTTKAIGCLIEMTP